MPSQSRAVGARRLLAAAAPFAWLVLVAAAYLTPALAHGSLLGPYDILGRLGLTSVPHAVVHNAVDSDEIEEFIPWQVLAWREVHSGQLPLWNPYSLLGMPLAFNFQSAPFSPEVALGYLFPLRLAHTATIAARLFVAGSGAYVLGRALGLPRLPALYCGTIYELSGAVTVWLGAYESGCLAWLGWVLAASVLVTRRGQRARDVAWLALALAALFCSGEPQIAILALLALAVFLALTLLPHARSERRVVRRSLAGHAIALAAGFALAAPVYLPGLQLAFASARSTGPAVSGLPAYDLAHLLFGDYNGLPTALSTLIGPDNLYVSMIYVGVIAVALSLVALPLARRRAEVAAFTVLAGLVLVLLFVRPVVDLMSLVPYLRVFRILLATPILDLALAMLAGFGAHRLASGSRPGSARETAGSGDRALALSIAALGLLLAVLALLLWLNVGHLDPVQRATRAKSFGWPAASLAGLGVLLAWRRRGASRHSARRGQAGLAGLLALETAFLAATGAGIPSSSRVGFPRSTAVAELRRDVGGALVGIGSCTRSSLPAVAIAPDANVVYGVDELAVLDPIVPKAYSAAYGAATGTQQTPTSPPGLFCGQIWSVAVARLFGVAYVVEPPGAPGPAGTRRVAFIDGEGLYAVPSSSRATLAALPQVPGGPFGQARAVRIELGTDGSARVVVSARRRSVLRLRLSAVPGWHATIDGRPLELRRWHDVMLQAIVPPGRHVVLLSYQPTAFTVGTWLAAACGAAALAALLAALLARAGPRWRSRRHPPRGVPA